MNRAQIIYLSSALALTAMLTGTLHQPILIVLPWAGLMSVFLLSANRSIRPDQRQPIGARLVQSLLLGGAFATVLLQLPFAHGIDRSFWAAGPWQDAIRLSSGYVGCLLAIWARIAIGRNYSADVAVCRGQDLVRTGPYGLVRHPIYTGLLIAILGAALTPATPMTLIGLSAAGIFTLWRIHAEDKLLRAQFGPDFDLYRHEVGAVVPIIY